MKTPKEILAMSKDELLEYKWSDDLDKKVYHCSSCSDCSDCYRCSDCSDCYRCSDCSDCYRCSYCYHCSDCSRCSHCSSCSNCFYCYSCSYCSGCRNAKNLKYAICNVEVGKEAYEKKMKELNILISEK